MNSQNKALHALRSTGAGSSSQRRCQAPAMRRPPLPPAPAAGLQPSQKRRSSAMHSRRLGEYHTASRAAPSVPGSTTSQPYTVSRRLGRTLSAVCSTPLSVLRSPSLAGTLVGSSAKRASTRARSCTYRRWGKGERRVGRRRWALPCFGRQRASNPETQRQRQQRQRSGVALTGPRTCCASDTLRACHAPRPSSANARCLSGRWLLSAARAEGSGTTPTTCGEVSPTSMRAEAAV